MKKLILSLFLSTILTTTLLAQANSGKIISKNSINSAGSCNCWLDRDGSWSVVPFTISTAGSTTFPTAPDYRNDDWSSDTINLPFNFCFFGDTITQVFINNNGNVSIGAPYGTFTALSFPDSTYQMVAPFWSDVDTRDSILSGIVYYKLVSNYLVVQWDHVGYYNTHADLTNTYQLIISDGNASVLPENKNVGFCYHDMNYTTGDASGGLFGFGGEPATVGVNYGDGINYIQIGLYDTSGVEYDGPFGTNDGVASLTNQSFAFNVCVNNFNVPPILSGDYICDTVNVCLGDTFTYEANFISPEQAQITTVTSNNHGLSGVNLMTNPGNQASIFLSFVASQAGFYTIDIIGTDDGVPNATTTIPLLFNIQTCTIGIDETSANKNLVYPNPVQSELYLELVNSNNDVTVTDIEGREIYRASAGQRSTVNTKDWTSGIYLVKVKSDDRTTTHKIIKN